MTREEAIYRLKNTAWLGTDADREATEEAVDMAIEALSADAVEVVRCKDCKHHHTSEMYEYCDLIAVKGRRQRVMKYCSLGERR